MEAEKTDRIFAQETEAATTTAVLACTTARRAHKSARHKARRRGGGGVPYDGTYEEGLAVRQVSHTDVPAQPSDVIVTGTNAFASQVLSTAATDALSSGQSIADIGQAKIGV